MCIVLIIGNLTMTKAFMWVKQSEQGVDNNNNNNNGYF